MTSFPVHQNENERRKWRSNCSVCTNVCLWGFFPVSLHRPWHHSIKRFPTEFLTLPYHALVFEARIWETELCFDQIWAFGEVWQASTFSEHSLASFSEAIELVELVVCPVIYDRRRPRTNTECWGQKLLYSDTSSEPTLLRYFTSDDILYPKLRRIAKGHICENS